MFRFIFAQQYDRYSCNLIPDSDFSFIEKSDIVPTINLLCFQGDLLFIILAAPCNSGSVQIINSSPFANLCRPVISLPLITNSLDLLQIQSSQRLTIPAIIMPFPCYSTPSGSG